VLAVRSRSKKESKLLENRVLLSFVGSHDPFRGDSASSGDGPVLSLLTQERFNFVHLLYNNDEFLRRASDLLKALRTRGDETAVAYESISAPDPTDYETLYDQMQHLCLELRRQHGEQTEIWIATSSGTPQMATCWLLLVLGGVLRGRLVQGVPPHKLKPGEPVFREIRPTQQRFPASCRPINFGGNSRLPREKWSCSAPNARPNAATLRTALSATRRQSAPSFGRPSNSQSMTCPSSFSEKRAPARRNLPA
jgi:Regulator of RNA terminal phosphate cyclase